MILLGAFYLLVDLAGFKKLAMPFVWIGMNPIAIYLLTSVVDFNVISGRVLGGPMADWVNHLVPGLGELLIALGGMFLLLLLSRYLYKKEVFFRI